MRTILDISIMVATFAGMEAVAWFTHKYIMHGWLWNLHRDHHKKTSKGFLEDNDAFFLIFAIPGLAGLFFGMQQGYNYLFWIGLGISLYGLAYFLVHDVFIHQRLKVFRNTENRYLQAIRRGHKIHHKHLGKEDGENFGMLWVPLKYFRKTQTRR